MSGCTTDTHALRPFTPCASLSAQIAREVAKQKAIEEGLKTLRDDGIRQVLKGVTALDEVMRVTQEDTVELD
jgi:type II secretory ATPase GspE/PulE/Tfp pilus assembly ATPase PilB-like protein